MGHGFTIVMAWEFLLFGCVVKIPNNVLKCVKGLCEWVKCRNFAE